PHHRIVDGQSASPHPLAPYPSSCILSHLSPYPFWDLAEDFCLLISLMKPSRNMVMTITLRTKQATLTLLHKISSLEFHNVFKFQVPSGLKDEVADFEVELRGAKFYSKEVRKVMIRTYEPMTFVQTDKPIYLPGQTGKNLSCMSYQKTIPTSPSSDFTLFPYLEDEFRTCLCGNERKSFRWTLTPSVIGDVIVSATAEAVVSDITCNNEVVSVPERGRSDTVSRTLKVKAEGIEKIKSSNLLLCPNGNFAVFFYSRVSVLLSGDIMGRALKNLDGLLRMPYGCAEQNMAVLAPNIYILQYLEDTKQLTPDIKAKGTNFLTSGYQRQLNYKNNDGAFSTFGSGGSGNTWLTAFTMRSFVKAQNFIFIDPKVINDAMIWLTNSQKGSGNFKLMGKFFNNQIKSYDLLLLLIILFSLNLLQETVTKSLSFTLTTATNRYLSVSVEMTSYVLLALLSPYSLPAAPPSPEALGYASGIVRWLTRQQKYYGGFSSTQDTVVALQALALYSTLVFNPEGSSSVNVKSTGDGDQTGKYTVEVEGNACVSVQIVCVPANKKASVTLSKIYFFLLCYRYTGKRETTNMVIVDIKMLSGFVPDEKSLKEPCPEQAVSDDHVVVYIKELSKDIPIQYDLELRQELPVSDLKPAVVKIYDYYQQSDQDEANYNYPCVAGNHL
uniref:Alpha-2-macroglobulin-like n=1 Tax=Labrus bergylta TaxID=56723 RepID=A0A3Q3NBL5_9LABR